MWHKVAGSAFGGTRASGSATVNILYLAPPSAGTTSCVPAPRDILHVAGSALLYLVGKAPPTYYI